MRESDVGRLSDGAGLIRWFIGYDPREAVAYHALAQSIMERSSVPVAVTPLALANLRGVFNRPRDPLQSNDFSFSRFLVPFLCGYQGFAIFSDCDMMLLDDPAKLWGLADHRAAIQCVQHDHRPASNRKYLGHVQTAYPRKNWSSVMLLNCWRLQLWTPAAVAQWSGLDLHRFVGVEDDLVRPLPPRWNHLVGVSAPNDDPALIHWTDGGPWFREYADAEYAAEWRQLCDRMTRADQMPQ